MARTLNIPIYPRSLRYGYVYWRKAMDIDIKRFLGNRKIATFYFDDSYLGQKNIDYANRRFSVGKEYFERVPDGSTTFRLSLRRDRRVNIVCK